MRRILVGMSLIFAGSAMVQLHAMMNKQTISVEFSQDAAKQLGVGKLELVNSIASINIVPGKTTASDILKTIAVTNNLDPNTQRVYINKAKCKSIYRNKELKQAYKDGLLSLWTMHKKTNLPLAQIPLGSPIASEIGQQNNSKSDQFCIEYDGGERGLLVTIPEETQKKLNITMKSIPIRYTLGHTITIETVFKQIIEKNEKLKEAYHDKHLSLWTINLDTDEPVDELANVIKVDEHGEIFHLFYD